MLGVWVPERAYLQAQADAARNAAKDVAGRQMTDLDHRLMTELAKVKAKAYPPQDYVFTVFLCSMTPHQLNLVFLCLIP